MRIRSKTSVSSVRTKFYLGLVSIFKIVEYIVSINNIIHILVSYFINSHFFKDMHFLINFIILISNGKSA